MAIVKEEFDCPCCGCNNVDPDMLRRLNVAQVEATEIAGHYVSFVINSGSRCSTHNESEGVGGSHTSSHLLGLAFDLKCETSSDRFAMLFGLFLAGFNRLGLRADFIHADRDLDKPEKLMWVY